MDLNIKTIAISICQDIPVIRELRSRITYNR